MRLFTAILLGEENKELIFRAEEKLKRYGRGTFTAKENLHLTVNFIGETNRLSEVKKAMEQAVRNTGAEEFSLTFQGLGKFKRREGDIYWIGAKKNLILWNIQKELTKELKATGFGDMDDRDYRPHLTLGRRVVVDSGFDEVAFEAEIPPIIEKVDRISLMKSEHLQGKLTYTEIYSVRLKPTA